MIVGVIGSGAIGPDLAYGFASALASVPGSVVYLHDIRQEALDAGTKRIEGYIAKGTSRGKITQKVAEAIKGIIQPTLDMQDLAGCEYVLEAATEELSIKRAILRDIEDVVGDDCLIGFATSGIPRSEIAAQARRPERCFVNHPFFPAWRSLPIEVVSSGSAEHEARMMKTVKALGKVPIKTADVPCFAADDIFCNYCSEAARIVAEGVATPAQVDAIVNTAIGGGGPFNVLDGTRGNLLTAHCQELMAAAETGSPWFEPPAILREKGNNAWHDRAAPGDPSYPDALGQEVLDRILAVLIARTYFVVDNEICAPTELNWMTRTALGFRKGLLEVAGELGADRVHAICAGYADKHDGFTVPASIAGKKLAQFSSNVRVAPASPTDDIAVVEIFRPEVKNALNRQTLHELRNIFTRLGSDEGVRGVVVTSFDGSLAGADITELARIGKAEDAEAICQLGQGVFQLAADMKKPVVAAVDGPVLGGGAELSMACHGRVVGPDLMMGQPEVNLGIIPGYGGTQRLPRIIGPDRAIELLRTGRPIGAKKACQWGWAHGEPTADIVSAAIELTRAHLSGQVKLAPVDPQPMNLPESLPPVDIGHHSRAVDAILVDVIRRGLAMPLAQGLALEGQGFGRCTATLDLYIGLSNFIQNGPRVPAAFLHE
ncbi:MAG: enoyl-CoA hydratase-related protein [Proteobacteria bacterium]|nr:enoyl-CoA hydratase-related protein [Pseudomonadota bacterium]